MTIDLSKDLEKIVHDAVRTGLYAREDDVIRDALIRLKQSLPGAAQTSGKGAKPAPRPLRRNPSSRSPMLNWINTCFPSASSPSFPIPQRI